MIQSINKLCVDIWFYKPQILKAVAGLSWPLNSMNIYLDLAKVFEWCEGLHVYLTLLLYILEKSFQAFRIDAFYFSVPFSVTQISLVQWSISDSLVLRVYMWVTISNSIFFKVPFLLFKFIYHFPQYVYNSITCF